MNELLQKHGCSNVFRIPEGLQELMADISREVLRQQPPNLCDFITNYLSALLITREHGIMAVKILDDLCDCRPSVSEHLMKCGMPSAQGRILSLIIKEEIERTPVVEGKEKVKEAEILKKILKRNPLDEEMTAKVCQITRNAYRDYWYRKKMLEQNLKDQPSEPWKQAAQHTLDIYKKTKPSFTELTRATQKIQAAYRGYHVRRNMLNHLKPKPKPHAPKVDLHGPVIDIAESRNIDLGPVVDIKDKVKKDDISSRFIAQEHQDVLLAYDTTRTIEHKPLETPKEITGDNSKDKERMSAIISDNKEVRKMYIKNLQNAELSGPSQAFMTSEIQTDLFGPKRSFVKKSVGGFSEGASTEPIPSYSSVRKSIIGITEPAQIQSAVKKFVEPGQTPIAKKSFGGFIEPNGVAEQKPVEIEESIASAPDSKATDSDGFQQDVEPVIPEDILPYGTSPASDLDMDMTSVDTGSKTASVPTSASTTAPTSDVDDIATEGEEEEE